MKLLERPIFDLCMFCFAMGAQSAMPTISDARAVERFQKDFGHACTDCDTEALRKRLARMKKEYHESRKTEVSNG